MFKNKQRTDTMLPIHNPGICALSEPANMAITTSVHKRDSLTRGTAAFLLNSKI